MGHCDADTCLSRADMDVCSTRDHCRAVAGSCSLPGLSGGRMANWELWLTPVSAGQACVGHASESRRTMGKG